MWFKAGTFAGLGTDAWLSNYAVGIGSTQFPIGTRLAAGSVQFTENDLVVVRNINASGIVTASSFRGDGSQLTGIVNGIIIRDDGVLVGTAQSIDFGTNLSVSPVSAGVVTVTTAGLSTVATSGSYNDLSNRPIIGTGLTFVDGVLSATGGDSLTFSAGVTTFATSIELDMAALTGLYQTITLTDNLTFTTANRASGRMLTLRLINGSGPKTLTFPSGWVFLGIKPSGIASSKTAVMSLSFFGTADTDCVASYAVQL